MSELTRRHFVGKSASAAAAVTVVGALVASRADARETGETGTDPIVAYLKDPSSGEIAVLSGDREFTVHDPGLAAQIARAAR